MARTKKQVTRTFEGTKKTVPFTIETPLTDEQAITILREGLDDSVRSFKGDCADAIEITALLVANPKLKIKANANKVAWGFRMAEAALKCAPLTLPKALMNLVAHRRPLSFEVEGFNVKIQQHGGNSKYEGQYMITDGRPFPRNDFYGRATSKGEWTPTSGTPKEVIEAIRTFGE